MVLKCKNAKKNPVFGGYSNKYGNKAKLVYSKLIFPSKKFSFAAFLANA